MQRDSLTSKPYDRPVVFVLFLAGGLMLFLLGNNCNSLFPTNRSAPYKWDLALLFLALAVGLRRSERLRKYWEVAFALSVGSFANALNWSQGNWLARLLPPQASTAQEIAVDKVSQCIPVVLAILLLTLLAGDDLGSIFLKKGNLRWGLRFGLISFGIFVAIFAAIAVLQAGAPSSQGLTATGVPLADIVAAIPWILVFIFANSLMEELWFRGIFLRRLSPLLGATYISAIEMVVFPVIVFVLGVVNGFVMLKTDSIWGSVLFHAGYDLMIIIPVLASG